jgi:hypothetical protein
LVTWVVGSPREADLSGGVSDGLGQLFVLFGLGVLVDVLIEVKTA